MRPDILTPLFAAVDSLPGIGPKTVPLVERLTGGRVLDLVFHLPTGAVDRRYAPMLADAEPGRIATVRLVVREIRGGGGPRAPTRVRCGDGTAEIDLVYFNASRDWLGRTFPTGREFVASGRIDLFNERPQMVHPDAVIAPEEIDSVLRVDPTYPLTAGLQARTLGKALSAALDRLPTVPEWLDPALVATPVLARLG